jgi:hypothetical protein
VGLELGLKAPCTTFRLVYVSEIQIQALRLRLRLPCEWECDSSLERRQQGPPATAQGSPGQGTQGRQGRGPLGKIGLPGLAIPLEKGAEQSRAESRGE